VEFLGFVDSGMMGTDTNGAPGSFWSADIDEAAARLAAILREEQAHVLTVYDAHGTYGHPDHIQVHRVGVRAGELAATPLVYEATINRDHVVALMRERSSELPEGVDPPEPGDFSEFGTPAAEITTRIDVRAFLEQKRAAMAAHASQIAESSFFLAMPPDAFTVTFGDEWFVRRGAPPDTPASDDLFAPLVIS
jgi:LmbE family N-acetylglucosaminyl deacetylase